MTKTAAPASHAAEDAADNRENSVFSATVAAIEDVAVGIKLFTFLPADGAVFPPATPGAHVDVHVSGDIVRQYSLVIDDAHSEGYTVAVKRDGSGRGGSVYLHERIKTGAKIAISPPRNHFPLVEKSSHVVLVAGGIGITPVWSMVHALRREGRSYEIHYATRRREDMAFREVLSGDPHARLHFDVEAGTVLDIARIVAAAPDDTHFYCCGPLPMMEAFLAACGQRPRDNVHTEFFAPRQEASSEGGFDIELARSKKTLRVPAGRRIIDVLLGAGINVPMSCEKGICGSCETRVLSGTPDHRDEVLSEDEREEGRTMMVCCSGSKSDLLVLDI